MVRVLHDTVLARAQPLNTLIEVIEAHVEVPGIAPRGLQPQSDSADGTHGHEAQLGEPHQRCLLLQLVEGGVEHSEHRDAERPVDGMVAQRVGPQHLGIEETAADDDHVVVAELVALPENRCFTASTDTNGAIGPSRGMARQVLAQVLYSAELFVGNSSEPTFSFPGT
jgi:hypothetical protein